MTQPLRLALLGAGGRGRSVLSNWFKHTDARLVAIVDPSPESHARLRQTFGDKVADAQSFTDVKGWYNQADCDLVLIASFDPQHAENCIDCFNAGLNLMVAKPMAQTIEQSDDIYLAWKRSGRIGVVDMQLRHTLLIEKAMQIIQQGQLGNIRFIQCSDYVGRGGVEFRSTRYRTKQSIQSWTLAKGVHFLDLLNLFAGGNPRRVYASGSRDVYGGSKPNDLTCEVCDERDRCFWVGSKMAIGGIAYPEKNSKCVFASEIDIIDNAAAVIDYDNGVRACYTECYFTPEYQTTYDIIGDRGAMFIRYAMDARLYIEVRPIGSAQLQRFDFYPHEQGGGAHGGGDVRIIKDMHQAMTQNQAHTFQPDIHAGRQAVALCLSIDESIHQGQPVIVPPLPVYNPQAYAQPAGV